MKKIITLLSILALCQQTFAQENLPTPNKFLGKYVPIKANCASSQAVVLVGKYETTIKYKNDSMTVKHEVCAVCMGGARATGEWVALLGKPSEKPPHGTFDVSFFEDGEIELELDDIAKKRFGAMSSNLKKCPQ